MKLSLSGRTVEIGGLETAMPVVDFIEMAARCGYDAVDLRWSQLRADTPAHEVSAIAETLDRLGLDLFCGQYNGPLDSPEDERAFLDFAGTLKGLGAHGVRMFHEPAVLKRAARLVAPLGLWVQYQMHTDSPFETIEGGASVVASIGEPNFGLVPEPANFALAGLEFSQNMLEPLKGAIVGVHVQTLTVSPTGEKSLRLSDGRKVRYTRVPYAENSCIPFDVFFGALLNVGFDGYVNELEPRPADGGSEAMAREAASFLGKWVR